MGWFNSLFSGLILAGFSKGLSGFRLVVLAMGVLGLVFLTIGLQPMEWF